MSLRTNGPAKVFALLPDEIRHVFTVFVFVSSCVVVHNNYIEEIPSGYIGVCAWVSLGFALLYTALKYIFRMFAGRKASVLSVSVFAVLLFAFLRNKVPVDADMTGSKYVSAGMLAMLVYALWLVLQLEADRLHFKLILCFLSDIVIITDYFYGNGICFINKEESTVRRS